ncbi:MAG: uracil-DNA glycosylase [Firmicutes bacterium]|nr:uracil-DNA glycosylase [Bacillota bacterium]
MERCRACRLGETRTRSVPGEGNPDADLMFIGEGPGVEEDLQGRPFVGAAGRLLDKIIAAMGMSRDQVFIGNIVKCRPPYNRVPESAEIEACLPFLARQIRLIRPRIIVLLGATALRALVDPGASITRARGQWIRVANTMIMPTFHPAALLRDPAKKRPLWEDMQQVLEQLKDPLRRGEE